MDTTKSDHIELQLSDPDYVPVDKNKLVYLCAVLLGTGVLFPYNTMLAASDYYDHTWPDKNVMFLAPLLISIASPFLQAIMVYLQALFSYRLRIVGGYSVFTVLVILLPLSVMYFSSKTSFAVALCIMFAIGATNAILQSTVFSLGAILPSNYTQAIMAGNGWSGVIVCAARIIIKLSFPDTDNGYRNGALLYFSLSSFVTVLCVIAYLVMIKQPFTKYYFDEDVSSSSSSSLLSESLDEPILDNIVPPSETYTIQSDQEDMFKPEVSPMQVLYKIRWMASSTFLVFVMTFLVFPGLLTSTDSTIKGLSNDWLGIICVTEFNVFDLIGRSLPNFLVLFSPDTVHFAVYSRFLLYPLFVLVVKWSAMSNTIYLLVLNAIFSVSSGYLSTLTLMYAPSLVEDHEKPTAGGYMSMVLVGGILVGSSLALGASHLYL